MTSLRRLHPGRWGNRTLLAAAAGLLVVALRGPLWYTRMESPQYRGEEALQVVVYADRIDGDLREIGTLNKYIGVRMPEHFPELRATSWVLGFLLVLALVVLASPSAVRQKAAVALFALMLLALAGGGVLLQNRLHQLGHERDHSIMVGVSDFSPPVFGTAKIANFTVRAGLEYGAWAFLAASLLTGWAAFAGKGNSPSRLQKEKAKTCCAELVSPR